MLQDIKSPADIKGLNTEQLKLLAEEIRQTIIKGVSASGGHLASSLGVVELSLALHQVFNTPEDKIIWDVGHQSYAHKLLTGRLDRFGSLRKKGGISGFPKRAESPYDAFGTGHSSTSISAATGMVMARELLKEKFRVVAVIGDGAMTSGLAFEGLNHAGQLGKGLIVVLNDNEMSISKNVGALSAYLNRILTGDAFKRFKKETKHILESIPKVGGTMSQFAQKLEEHLKGFFLPGIVFEELGFNYVGPMDGHDVGGLVETLGKIKDAEKPTLLHIITLKGKGYKYSENDPSVFHGIGPFEAETGKPVSTAPSREVSYSEAFGDALIEAAREDPRVVAITAAMKEGTGLTKFDEAFPGRLYDVGIAEPHAVTFAAGLASAGVRPVVAIYSTFLQRSYDEIIHDVCLQGLPVVFAVDRAGLVGEDGPTHHGVFDISYLRHIPNLTVMAPRGVGELKRMLAFALKHDGPTAIRFPRGKGLALDTDERPLQMGRAETMREGSDLAILAVGSTLEAALGAADRLSTSGVSARVVNMRFIKPMDRDAVAAAAGLKRIITVEDNALEGGFGSAVGEVLAQMNIAPVELRSLGIPDKFIEHGTQAELREKCGIDEEGVLRAALLMIKHDANLPT